jgi:hypothetical protein
MAPEDLPAAVSPKPGGGSTRSVGATLGLWKDNLRQLYEGEALRSVRFRYALLALDIVTVLFIVATSFVPRTRIIEALDVVFGNGYLRISRRGCSSADIRCRNSPVYQPGLTSW